MVYLEPVVVGRDREGLGRGAGSRVMETQMNCQARQLRLNPAFIPV